MKFLYSKHQTLIFRADCIEAVYVQSPSRLDDNQNGWYVRVKTTSKEDFVFAKHSSREAAIAQLEQILCFLAAKTKTRYFKG